jgi:hypothetical protein
MNPEHDALVNSVANELAKMGLFTIVLSGSRLVPDALTIDFKNKSISFVEVETDTIHSRTKQKYNIKAPPIPFPTTELLIVSKNILRKKPIRRRYTRKHYELAMNFLKHGYSIRSASQASWVSKSVVAKWQKGEGIPS